ncbi:MAG: tRNA threonylcarbamoyladenosine biosynthesis protein TsaB [Bradymonadia bacterium]
MAELVSYVPPPPVVVHHRLAVDTSSDVQSVALERDGHVIDELRFSRRAHSRGLMGRLDEAIRRHDLEWSDLDTLVVGLGPGSFTGLRVALAVVKGIAMSGGANAIGVCSLVGFPASLPHGHLCAVAWNAHQGLLYGGVYRSGASAECVVPAGVYKPQEFAARLPKAGCLCVGDGFDVFAEHFADRGGDISPGLPQASAAGLLLYARAHCLEATKAQTLEPTYFRRSEAEDAWDRKHGVGAPPVEGEL